MWKNDTNTNNTYLKKYLLSPRAISCTEVCYIPFVSLFLRISFTQLVSSRIFSFFSRFHIYSRCKYANESKTSSSSIIKKKKTSTRYQLHPGRTSQTAYFISQVWIACSISIFIYCFTNKIANCACLLHLLQHLLYKCETSLWWCFFKKIVNV